MSRARGFLSIAAMSLHDNAHRVLSAFSLLSAIIAIALCETSLCPLLVKPAGHWPNYRPGKAAPEKTDSRVLPCGDIGIKTDYPGVASAQMQRF